MKGSTLQLIFIIIIAALIVTVSLSLSGCTTTKTVYVPAPCPKLVVSSQPKYDVEGLTMNDGNRAWVIAIADSFDACNTGYKQLRNTASAANANP